jgi:predicted ribosomally synthesized peptide with SipW-like signal peptide
MTDEKFDVSRRTLLGSLGLMSGSAAIGGSGTAALFSDQEGVTDNAVTAGALDLEVGWEMTYNGAETRTGSEDLGNDPGPIFQIPPHGDVKPCDYGEATIGLHVYDNPAWIHMGGELTADDDNGLTEPESEVDDTGGDGEGELADAIFARAWYDDGNNVYDPESEQQIVAGSLRDVFEELNEGILLDGNVQSESSDGSSCVELGKHDETPTNGETYDFSEGSIDIVGVHTEDGEVVGIDWESTLGLCAVVVAGGGDGGSKTVETCYDCVRSGTAFAPKNENNRNRRWYEISNVTFYYCQEQGDDKEECFENSTTQYIGFEWELPCSVGNEVQSDSVEFDLKFHAQQCRHNDEPDNPYS